MASSFSSSSSCVTLFFLVAFLVSRFPSCVDSRGGERSCGFAGKHAKVVNVPGTNDSVGRGRPTPSVLQDVTHGNMTNHDLEKNMKKLLLGVQTFQGRTDGAIGKVAQITSAGVMPTGVHGRIFSAVSGQPLPAAVNIKGINYTIKAGELFGDYHRMLAPGQNCEVTASMPGYFPKTARFSIEDEAVNADFILNPVVGESRKLKPLKKNCRYGYGSMQKSEMMLMLTGNHLHVSIAAFAILGFLLFLFRRRINFRIPKADSW